MRRLSTSLVFLCLAWFCAHQPQGLVVDVVHWLRGSTHFSHQQRLADELRVALADAARSADEPARVVAADAGAPTKKPALPAPVVVVTGKVSLVCVRGMDFVPPFARRGRIEHESFAWGNRVGDVPTPVPRGLG